MSKWKRLTRSQLFMPLVCIILVLLVNVVYDIANGNPFYNFFRIYMSTGEDPVLQGRIVNILNRGSEVAILAIGMTLVVSSSAGTDISVGSVMSLCACVCCTILAGDAAPQATELAVPLIVGVIAALAVGCLCGSFNGFLVSKLNIQPMVATLILYSAARAIGLLVNHDFIVYVRNDTFGVLGGYIGFFPTPIVIAAACVIIMSLVLKKTALGMYIQSVGINKKASRIAGLNSSRIIFMCYLLCGLCAGLAGVVASSRITSADPSAIGLNLEMDAILAVAIGGNSLGGGKFNLAGSIIGAYTIQAITTTMYNLGVSSAVEPVFKAVIIIIIVVIQAPPVKAWFARLTSGKSSGAKKEVVSV